MFKAIFWDNDGVLVNTEPFYFEATKRVLARAGVDLTLHFYVHDHLKYNRNTFDLARDKGIDEDEIYKMRMERNELYLNMIKKSVPVKEGVTETLDKLMGNIQMGVVTSTHREFINIILEEENLKKYFSFVLTCDDVKNVKPDPELYLLALKTVNLEPSECLVIEDTERGVMAAKLAGITCYAIPNELSKDNDFSKADKVLNHITELPALLLS